MDGIQQGSQLGRAQGRPLQSDREGDLSPGNEGFKRAFFDGSADAIVLFNPPGDIVSVNAAAARIFGCDEEQIVGTQVLQWIAERNRARHLADAQALMAGSVEAVSRGRTDEASVLRRDGSELPVEVTKSRLQVGDQLLYAVTVRDISERRKATDELIESKDELVAALSSMRDSVCIVDARGTLVRFNDSFVALHRFKSRAECQRTLPELMAFFEVTTLDGALLTTSQRPTPRALNGESGSGIEHKLRRKDTGETWIGSYSFSPIHDKFGVIVGAVVTMRDVTQEKDMLSALKHSRAELRRLVARQQSAVEAERKRLARELHDDLQQTLAALRLNVAALEQQSRALSPDVSQAATAALTLSDCAIQSTRRMISGMRPQVLEDFGLKEALVPMLVAFGDRTEIRWDLDFLGDTDEALPEEAVTCLYRVAQESIQNIEKHAQASFVGVLLDTSAPDQVVLQICDDGVGVQAIDLLKRDSYGVLGMEERVRAIGGALTVKPGAVSGTVVTAVVPLRRG